MDELSDDLLAMLVIRQIVGVLHNDFGEFMTKWIEVRGYFIGINDIKEEKTDILQLHNN